MPRPVLHKTVSVITVGIITLSSTGSIALASHYSQRHGDLDDLGVIVTTPVPRPFSPTADAVVEESIMESSGEDASKPKRRYAPKPSQSS